MKEKKQLTQGVRCSHVYLLSTLEDLALSNLLLPQISLKKQANNKLWRLFYHSRSQKTLMVPNRLLLRACVYLFKVNGFLCILVSIVEEKI